MRPDTDYSKVVAYEDDIFVWNGSEEHKTISGEEWLRLNEEERSLWKKRLKGSNYTITVE